VEAIEIIKQIKKHFIQEPNRDNTGYSHYYTIDEEDLERLELAIRSQLQKEREEKEGLKVQMRALQDAVNELQKDREEKERIIKENSMQNEILTTMYHLIKTFDEKQAAKYLIKSLEKLNDTKTKMNCGKTK